MSRIQEQDAERLVNALDREIRSRGWGTIGAINTALGRSDSWWQQRVKSKDITVKQLLQVLDRLGLDPVKFVRQVIGSEDGLELDSPQGEVPEIVQKARARKPQEHIDDRFGVALLNTLDDHRNQDPAKVVEIAAWAVDHVELELLPRLLGVVGSAFGLQFRLEEAEHCIYAGIEIAREQKNGSPVGNLLTRLSYAISNRGDRKEALRMAEKAALFSLRHKDLDGLGRALVAQGSWLYYLDRTSESIQVFEQALSYLLESSIRNRFAAFQFLGLAHQGQGDLNAALQCVEKAGGYLPQDDDIALGKLLWLQGRILAGLHRIEEAASMLEKVVKIFQELHLGETALATCELVRIQLHQGQGEEAFQTAISMRSLLEPLKHNKIISAAIADLLRSGQEGLTLSLLERVTAQIEKERQRLDVWRSLRIR